MDRQEILGMGVCALRDALKDLGLGVQGRKADLQERLLGHYGFELEGMVDECEGSVHSFGSAVGNDAPDIGMMPLQKSMYTLKDVEDSLSVFSGAGSPDVDQWVNELEEMGTIVQWSQLQMFVYGRQLLTGAARLYVKGQSGINNWSLLKKCLLEEFGTSFSSAEVHRQLQNRRLGKQETMMEFLYSIMELGKRVALDEKSVVEYFINGIPDSRFNKAVLYQAGNISELKRQIKV